MSDLSSLPDIVFCDADEATVESSIIAAYENIAGVTLFPGNPVRLFLEALAYVIAQQRAIIDNTGKMNLLRYATGDYLDHLGALVGVSRLAPTAAATTLRFSLGQALGFVVAIPVGTRAATADGQAVFVTTAAAEIPAGQLVVDVAAECRVTGAIGNGLAAGQINTLVDPLAYVASVANVTASDGGSDAEADDALRDRIRLAPESFSVAGPDGAYAFWARTAHQAIADVSVTSPSPGQVDIRPLMTGGELPSAEILAAVLATVSADKTRPLTDQVLVHAPELVPYDIALTYYLRRSDAALVAQLQTAVEQAVAGYRSWQKGKLGRDVNPTELIGRLYAVGVKRVAVASPAYTPVEAWQVARDGTVSVAYGGLEDE